MSPRSGSPFFNIAAFTFLMLAAWFVLDRFVTPPLPLPPQGGAGERATAVLPEATSTEALVPITPAIATTSKKKTSSQVSPASPSVPAKEAPLPPRESPVGLAARVQEPYSFPSESPGKVAADTQAALVNILCKARDGGPQAISGSGVLIDSRGVILTNAHVAQYVLLAQSPRVNLSCTVRRGSPAHAAWTADILYLPPVWIAEHAEDIGAARAASTGSHDYALLYVTGSAGETVPSEFPALPPDTRHAIAFTGDHVIVAGYPAEFIGGGAPDYKVFPVSSPTEIGSLFTFARDTVDLISTGGVIEAQSGSSGGAVVNPWGRLVGLIATASEGTTTSERDLRALTLNYIDRNIEDLTGAGLADMLGGDIGQKAAEFEASVAPQLREALIEQLEHS